MARTVSLTYGDNKRIELPVVQGSEGELGIDITQLRSKTGMITLDSGYSNTGACTSTITFIDGEQGILRHRGIPIEQLAEKSTFVETAWLLIFGRLSAENELIALRSNGISVPRVCVPVFFLALVCVAICFWINVDIAPKAQEQMKAALYNIATSNPIAMFGSDQIIDEFPGKLIYVEKKEVAKLENILMYELNDHGDPVTEVHARSGQLLTDLEGKQQIILRLKDERYQPGAHAPRIVFVRGEMGVEVLLPRP